MNKQCASSFDLVYSSHSSMSSISRHCFLLPLLIIIITWLCIHKNEISLFDIFNFFCARNKGKFGTYDCYHMTISCYFTTFHHFKGILFICPIPFSRMASLSIRKDVIAFHVHTLNHIVLTFFWCSLKTKFFFCVCPSLSSSI